MTRDERKQAKRKEILEIAEQFRDERKNVDLSKMRLEKPKVYAKISYYFNNIDEFMNQLNSNDNQDSLDFDSSKAGALRNKLAFAKLSILRDQKRLSYEEIGNIYDKSKMYMSKLYRDLEVSTMNSDTGTTLNRPVVRNQLAFEMIEFWINEYNLELEDIAAEYDVDSIYVERMYEDWTNLFRKEKEIKIEIKKEIKIENSRKEVLAI